MKVQDLLEAVECIEKERKVAVLCQSAKGLVYARSLYNTRAFVETISANEYSTLRRRALEHLRDSRAHLHYLHYEANRLAQSYEQRTAFDFYFESLEVFLNDLSWFI